MRSIDEVYKTPAMAHDPGSIGYLEKIFLSQLVLMAKPALIVETGTFKGQTTKFLCEFLKLNRIDCLMCSFDLQDVIEGLLDSDKYFREAANVRLIKGRLPQTLDDFLSSREEQVDFAIVDSEHSYRQVMSELKVLHKYLRNGAYVFCHDYLENDAKYAGVVQAVKEFAHANKYEVLALSGDKVWGAAILRKPSA